MALVLVKQLNFHTLIYNFLLPKGLSLVAKTAKITKLKNNYFSSARGHNLRKRKLQQDILDAIGLVVKSVRLGSWYTGFYSQSGQTKDFKKLVSIVTLAKRSAITCSAEDKMNIE